MMNSMHINSYKDIMDTARPPLPPGHPRMDVLNRAKLFAPFAALRGFEERIARETDKSRDRYNSRAEEYQETEYETQGYGADEYYTDIYP